MALELNPNLYPPGGFFFKEAFGLEIRGSDLSSLVSAVKDYRKNAGLPEGEPHAEVVNQICARSPAICRSGAEVKPVATPAQTHLVFRVVTSTKVLQGRTNPLVRSPQAYARAEICKLCIHHKEWAKHCPPCKANAIDILKGIVSPNEPVGTVTGCACDLAGDDLSVAVWLEKPERLNDAPAACWRTGRDTDEIS